MNKNSRIAALKGCPVPTACLSATAGYLLPSLFLVVLYLLPPPALANGTYRNGVSAASQAQGGTGTSWADDALTAMTANPAGLAAIDHVQARLGATLVVVDGEFSNAANRNVDIDTGVGVIPDAAVAVPLPGHRITLGLSLSPLSLLDSDWNYVDAPGGAGGVSYGLRRQRAEFIGIRTAAGAGVRLTPLLSAGATVGFIYNDNKLEAPYIFQSHPVLKGLKTLLDLKADGTGWNASFGLHFKPADRFDLGLTYTTATVIHAKGRADGDIGPQLGLATLPFHYDAEVRTIFPQMASTGLSFKARPDLRLSFQIDWINWSDAFEKLPVHLTHGSNAAINGVLGSTTIDDVAPLNWRDRFVYRLGAEYDRPDHWRLRAGYSYGGNPVPDRTLTPLTAVIFEHTLTAGAGYRTPDWQVDLSYQWDLPAQERVGQSALLSGEYNNSKVNVSIHWLAVTFGWR
jgi:long-chain fatty acid transport protein